MRRKTRICNITVHIIIPLARRGGRVGRARACIGTQGSVLTLTLCASINLKMSATPVNVKEAA